MESERAVVLVVRGPTLAEAQEVAAREGWALELAPFEAGEDELGVLARRLTDSGWYTQQSDRTAETLGARAPTADV